MRVHDASVWRRAVRVGLVVSSLLAALWVFSAVWSVGWRSRGLVYVGVGHGAAGVTEKRSGWRVSDFEPGWKFERARGPLAWSINRHSGGRDWWVWVPLWMPLAGSMALTGAAWVLGRRAARRARLGWCAACGYDRAGLAAGARCPECGAGE